MFLGVLLSGVLLISFVSLCTSFSHTHRNTQWLLVFWFDSEINLQAKEGVLPATFICIDLYREGVVIIFNLFNVLYLGNLIISNCMYFHQLNLYGAGGEPHFNNGTFNTVPIHIVTYAGQLPIEFLEPSPDRQLVIGLDCEGVDLCRTGTLCIMQVSLYFVTLNTRDDIYIFISHYICWADRVLCFFVEWYCLFAYTFTIVI